MQGCKNYCEEHELLRASAQSFFARECVPYVSQWEKNGIVPREVWLKAAAAGFLCPSISEDYGGGGGNYLHNLVINEEQVRAGITGFGMPLHNDVISPYIERYGTEDQKQRWLPRMASGELIGAIAMTEPGTGSDLQNVKTEARLEGNQYILNGQKTFISCGQTANLIIVVAKTDTSLGARGVSLLVVETDHAEGFSRGRNLEKVGQKSADTSELFFADVRVPPENLVGGEEGQGFAQLMEGLVQERLMIGAQAVAGMERAIEVTIAYTKERTAFGRAIIDFQNTRFKLAEMKTIATAARAFLTRCVDEFLDDQLDADTAAMLKWWTTDNHFRITDECAQLHGGYGYMLEYPIARMFVDSRVERIYGGANEIMKDLIGRSL